jgi:hypothetical protein
MSVALPQTTLTVTNLGSSTASPVIIADGTGYDLTSTVITVAGAATVSTQVTPDYFVNVTPQLLDLTSRGLITYSGGTGEAICMYLSLVNLATSTTGAISFVPGFSGRIAGMHIEVDVDGTSSGAGSIPLQLAVTPTGGSATPCTGGALTVTLANTTPVFKVTASTPVTAGGSFGPADTISINTGTGVVFTAGAVNLIISLSTI